MIPADHSAANHARFFFYHYGNHGHLHSFPTRRSSDLPSSDSSSIESPQPTSMTMTRRLIGFSVEPRSEEHTSELQSLRQLVCRLLLEKKKIELIANEGYDPT